MKSYKVVQFGEPLAEVTHDAPVPDGTQVLLRVTACGVCHSDVHLRAGHFDLGADGKIDLSRGLTPPFTLGHEIAGEVVALGPDAGGAGDAVSVGDARVVYPWIGCGGCETCGADEEHRCRAPRNIGVNLDGGYSDHILVPHPRYLLPFDGLSAAEACTYACSGLTAYGALKKIGALAPGDPLVIIGAGGVGLAGVRLARHVTGVAAVAAEIAAPRREAALAAGASAAIDPAAADAVRAFVKQTGGAAAAIDFVGSAESARFGFDILRKGGTLVIVGLFGGGLALPVPHFPLREVTVTGSYVGSLQDLRDLLQLARDGAVGQAAVETRPLAEAEATLCDLAAGRITGRRVLVPG
ncbi:MAG: alcohol dehydrogenase catalytic domain-containing protein [Alphaproteobacteria bacterium]|nr:alcohol dehydrogenase catalytic domain-containing protein [Alphaproteobacteria bacterium]